MSRAHKRFLAAPAGASNCQLQNCVGFIARASVRARDSIAGAEVFLDGGSERRHRWAPPPAICLPTTRTLEIQELRAVDTRLQLPKHPFPAQECATDAGSQGADSYRGDSHLREQEPSANLSGPGGPG